MQIALTFVNANKDVVFRSFLFAVLPSPLTERMRQFSVRHYGIDALAVGGEG